MQNRRYFLQTIKRIGLGQLLLQSPFALLGDTTKVTLCILHSNDTHSQIDPFPDGAPQYAGLGGIQARADLIFRIRKEQNNVLLLDAGDFLHSGPWLDQFKGAPEIEVMNRMGYDAVTIGEHDLDSGAENLYRQLEKAKFHIVGTNIDIRDSPLKNVLCPYSIIEKGGIKIGVISICNSGKNIRITTLKNNKYGSVPPYAGIVFETASFLKRKEKCDIIICLSRLGINSTGNSHWSDIELAKSADHIDIIIGGNSHTLLKYPLKVSGGKYQEIIINQAGWGGTHLGRIDLVFSGQKKFLSLNAQTVEIGK